MLHSWQQNRKQSKRHKGHKVFSRCKGWSFSTCMSDQSNKSETTEERLIGRDCASKCAKETTDAKEKQAVDSKLLLQDRKRWVVTMTHTLTHTVTHTVTHTKGHQGRIHEWPKHPGPWCAINKWQSAYWSKKNDGFTIKNNEIKLKSQYCIKWLFSRSTYQHFLGCWLMDKCGQNHTENKTKQKNY